MAWEARWGLKRHLSHSQQAASGRLNGLGSPMGIETM